MNNNNNWNEFFTWWTRHASVINGVYSEYSPAVRDRTGIFRNISQTFFNGLLVAFYCCLMCEND